MQAIKIKKLKYKIQPPCIIYKNRRSYCIYAFFFVPLRRILCFDDYDGNFQIHPSCVICAFGHLAGDAQVL